MYHRRIFDAVGLLEESFVAYFEDADLCFRARLAGFDAIVVPEAVAYHIGSASIADNTWWRSAQCFRNHALLVLRNMPGTLLWKHAGAILRERRHQRRMMFSALRAQFGGAKALAISAYYMAWLALSMPRALAQRRAIQRKQNIHVDALQALLRTAWT
jgi:GT2 family glycosyltransferase